MYTIYNDYDNDVDLYEGYDEYYGSYNHDDYIELIGLSETDKLLTDKLKEFIEDESC